MVRVTMWLIAHADEKMRVYEELQEHCKSFKPFWGHDNCGDKGGAFSCMLPGPVQVVALVSYD